jgi:hypothetical protein
MAHDLVQDMHIHDRSNISLSTQPKTKKKTGHPCTSTAGINISDYLTISSTQLIRNLLNQLPYVFLPDPTLNIPS